MTPAVHREILAALIRQPERVRLLLDAVEARRLAPGDIDAVATDAARSTAAAPRLRERAARS